MRFSSCLLSIKNVKLLCYVMLRYVYAMHPDFYSFLTKQTNQPGGLGWANRL